MSRYTDAVTPGDVTAAVIHILRNDTNLRAAFPDLVVSDTRVTFSREQHWIQVTRRGGVPVQGNDRFLDYARIDLDAYGPTRTAIIDLTRLARDAVANAAAPEDGWIGFGVCITDVDNEQGANEMPDPKSDDPRGFQVLGITVANRPDHMGPPDAGGSDTETPNFVELESVEIIPEPPFLLDTFTRTASNGWGSGWVSTLNPSNLSVNGSVGVAVGTAQASYADTPANIDVSGLVVPASLPSSGNATMTVNVRVQTTGVGDAYRYWVNVNSLGQLSMFMFRGGVTLGSTNALEGASVAGGYRFRCRSIGNLHRFRVWLAADPESDYWQLSVADSAYPNAGLAGITDGLYTNFRITTQGATITWHIDDIEITEVDS